MEEKLIVQAKEQEELRNKNMELSKINKRLANIEEHVNKNSIDIARTTNTIYELSVVASCSKNV